MTVFDPKHLETAFVRPGTPMFSDILVRLEDCRQLPATRKRDMASGLRRVASVLGRAPEDVPADPRWLQPRLSKVLPAAHGMSEKSWRNSKSNAKSALAAVGIVKRTFNQIEDLSPEWQALWSQVLKSKDKTLQPPLCRFIHFLNRLGLRPEEVSGDHALAYREGLSVNEISKSPETAYRAAVNGWNLAVTRLPAWPRQRLPLPSRLTRIALPVEDLSAGFVDDVDRFLDRHSRADPLDPNAPSRALSPVTINHYRTKTLKFAGAVVRAGVPAERLRSLSDLVQPAVAEAGYRWLLERTDGKSTRDLTQISSLMAQIGREHVRLPDEAQNRLDTMAERLRVPVVQGMTTKNRTRLRALEDPAKLAALLNLPDVLMARVAKAPGSYANALLSEEAVAIVLLLFCPVRRKNLLRIEFDRHLQRFGDGRTFLVFEGSEVKNGRRIEFELPVYVAKMIEFHRRARVPFLCEAGSPFLFPARRGDGPLHSEVLASRVRRRIEREIGVTLNLHLFRHLAAKLYLDAHPGQYEVVRQLLGHAELSRTLAAYAGFEAGSATRLYAEVLARGKAQ